jgi:ABC-type sugar transport system ATPase subunit
MNILDCSLVDNRLEFQNFSLNISPELASKLPDTASSFQLGIRPEFIQVYSAAGENTVPFQVQVVENTGAYWIVTYINDSIRIKARVPESMTVADGQEHHLFFPEDRINIFHQDQRVV